LCRRTAAGEGGGGACGETILAAGRSWSIVFEVRRTLIERARFLLPFPYPAQFVGPASSAIRRSIRPSSASGAASERAAA
jgi:hypothetical protein